MLRQRNGLLAILHIQFLIQAANMGFDRARGHLEVPGDALVGEAGVDGVEYLLLAWGEGSDRSGQTRGFRSGGVAVHRPVYPPSGGYRDGRRPGIVAQVVLTCLQ